MTIMVGIVGYATAVLAAVSLHEYAHALVAVRRGDLGPRLHGRLTLNPRRSADAFGTVILPALLIALVVLAQRSLVVFAYAKPLPVDAQNLARKERDLTWVMLAGILVNLVIGLGCAVVLRFVQDVSLYLDVFLGAWIHVHLTFAVLHLIPVPPLDGARLIARFLGMRPREVLASAEQYAPLTTLVILIVLPLLPIFVINPVIQSIVRLIVFGD